MAKKTDNDRLKEIKSRFSQLEEERRRFESRWITAQNYTSASVYDWENLDCIPSLPKRFSSSPCHYLSILVSGLVGYSISPNIVWFKLSLEDFSQTSLYGVKDWLEQVEEIMTAEFKRSNLYSQAEKMIKDAATIGHGVMLCDYDIASQRLRFTTERSNEIYLDCNSFGEVDTVYRRFLITLRNAVEFFGLEALDEDRREAYKNVARWNDKIEILQVVEPRRNRDTGKPDAKNMPFACYFIDRAKNKIIQESGYIENPFAVFQWNQIAGFAYSESPVQGAMTDIKALNIMEETRLKIAQTSAEPPMQVSDSVRNLSLVPAGVTYTKKDEQIQPIRTGENYPIALDVVQQKQQEVKDWFNVDFFLMLQQKQGQMTATEVMELQGEKAAILSNLIVNLNNALQKIISRSFNLLMQNHRLPPPPLALQNAMNNSRMKVDFVGTFAQAQKKYHTMGGLATAMQTAATIMQIYPNSADYINADELMKRALEGQGMPQAIIREDKDVEKIREMRAQQEQAAQQQAQQQEMLNTMMKSSGGLSKPIEQGSMMDAINKQLAGGLQQ